ncbi:shikimate kinase [Lederbergia sp. NSJ-179]|uniref:shikimate kinase n=1 Tax=Lederbergia sp. NSJ-179 TaxID=2931402 RepID=UPI001FD2CD54|nr:shikimate kinase [Lederbergia sp. NSJ-179]MCJ7839319.1 shikimate kinase [Lederbergia sp. NSJ-179]
MILIQQKGAIYPLVLLICSFTLLFLMEVVHIYLSEWGYVNEMQQYYKKEIKVQLQQIHSPDTELDGKIMISELSKGEQNLGTRSLYLIGFMGAGKTSVGEQLAARCGYSVIDTDQQIEKKMKMGIPQIFEQYGEDYFRDVESQVLKELSQESCIITTGGGIILREENRQLLKNGNTFFLQCHPDSIAERIGLDSSRPLIHHKTRKEIAEMYQNRLPYYLECATAIIDTTDLTIEEVARSILQKMNVS